MIKAHSVYSILIKNSQEKTLTFGEFFNTTSQPKEFFYREPEHTMI